MQTPSHSLPSVGFSASVELFIHVGQKTLCPTHVSDCEIIFAEPPELSPGPAKVEVVVDGLSSIRTVEILPHVVGATRLAIISLSVSCLREDAMK